MIPLLDPAINVKPTDRLPAAQRGAFQTQCYQATNITLPCNVQ